MKCACYFIVPAVWTATGIASLVILWTRGAQDLYIQGSGYYMSNNKQIVATVALILPDLLICANVKRGMA